MGFRHGLAALAAAVALSAPFAVSAAEGYRIAFVEVPRLLQDAPQVAAVRESLKKEFARRDKDLVALQGDIKKIEEKLQRDGAILSDAETQRLERDLVAKQRKLKNAQGEFQEELSLRQQLAARGEVPPDIGVGDREAEGDEDQHAEGGVEHDLQPEAGADPTRCARRSQREG